MKSFSGKFFCLSAILLSATLGIPLPAAILVTGDNAANITDPGTGLPWDYVARITNEEASQFNHGTAVYLGHRYMITANHVGVNSNWVTFNGSTTFERDTSFTPIQIGDPGVDLKIFRLATDPGMQALNLYSRSAFGDQDKSDTLSHIVAWGKGRHPDDTGNPWEWGGVDTVDKRWGTNVVVSSKDITVGGLTTHSLVTILGTNQGNDEIAVVHLDSGGGLFVEIDDTWYLAGIAVGVASRTADHSTFGNESGNPLSLGDENYFARMATYEGEITAIIPEPRQISLLAGILVCGLIILRKRST